MVKEHVYECASSHVYGTCIACVQERWRTAMMKELSTLKLELKQMLRREEQVTAAHYMPPMHVHTHTHVHPLMCMACALHACRTPTSSSRSARSGGGSSGLSPGATEDMPLLVGSDRRV